MRYRPKKIQQLVAFGPQSALDSQEFLSLLGGALYGSLHSQGLFLGGLIGERKPQSHLHLGHYFAKPPRHFHQARKLRRDEVDCLGLFR